VRAAAFETRDIPILFVLGERDDLTDPDANSDALRQSARRAGNDQVSIEVLDHANHGLLEVRSGADGEPLPIDHMAPRFHQLVLDWVASRYLADG
jgi:pimeloyl-ACP methyl ester carboxylesterase